MRRTDKMMIKQALGDAILYAESLIDAYGGADHENAVIEAKADIVAFRRILKRRYADPRTPHDILYAKVAATKAVPVHELFKDEFLS